MSAEPVFGLSLWTTDIAGLSRFFELVAGMTVEQLHPGYASLRANGARLILHDDESYRGHPWYEALGREGVARGIGAEIRVEVPDVEAAYGSALRLGALAIEAPCEVDGTRECQVMGPDGYLLALWQWV
jgi:catechol 2,3-dioxygenase-like lactoylglutathione lyase family enzyme